jgi:hypothetical protein
MAPEQAAGDGGPMGRWRAVQSACKAASYLAKFVEPWKDADPQFQPKVRDARARLVRLGGLER